MQYSKHIPFSSDNSPEDDIDVLFQQLQPIEPPPALVSKILAQVQTQATRLAAVEPVALPRFDRWVVLNTKRVVC